MAKKIHVSVSQQFHTSQITAVDEAGVEVTATDSVFDDVHVGLMTT